MSINSINTKDAEQSQSKSLLVNAVQINADGPLGHAKLDASLLGVKKDSINISSSTILKTDSRKQLLLLGDQSIIISSDEAESSVANIISILQNNGFKILNSLRSPSASKVLNFISDTV
jgi:hypothetical protein